MPDAFLQGQSEPFHVMPDRARAGEPHANIHAAIAQALAINLGDLIEMPGATSAVSVIRAEDHAFHDRSDKFCRSPRSRENFPRCGKGECAWSPPQTRRAESR